MNKSASNITPSGLWQKLSSSYRLMVPGANGNGAGRYVPGDWRTAPFIPGTGTTAFSVKEHFFPQTDRLLDYCLGQEAGFSAVQPESQPTVFWGLRPCDARALSVMDLVFAGTETPLDNYAARRAGSLAVAFACPEKCPGGFCERLGIDRGLPAGADLAFIVDGDGWSLSALTERGGRIAGLDVDPPPVPDNAKPIFAGKVKEIFDHPLWDELAETCLSCRACTYACPTCHCFTIVDEHLRDEGMRATVWDSCAVAGFTRMAGGHNPRGEITARVRQRLLHKLAYFPERYGVPACTGCGRCAAVCPMGRSFENMLDRLEELIADGR